MRVVLVFSLMVIASLGEERKVRQQKWLGGSAWIPHALFRLEAPTGRHPNLAGEQNPKAPGQETALFLLQNVGSTPRHFALDVIAGLFLVLIWVAERRFDILLPMLINPILMYWT